MKPNISCFIRSVRKTGYVFKTKRSIFAKWNAKMEVKILINL